MKTFTVTVYQEWTECGTIEVEAEDEDCAAEIARDALVAGSEDIMWEDMDPGISGVESVDEK